MKYSLSQLLQSTAWLGVAFALVVQPFTFPLDTRGNGLHAIETLRVFGAMFAGIPMGLAISSVCGNANFWCMLCGIAWSPLMMIILILSGI